MKKSLWYTVGFVLQNSGVTRLVDNKSDAVLTFHSVGDGYYDDITTQAFEQLLDRLESKYRIVDLPALIERRSDEKRLALTFDDGYAGFYSDVVPALRKQEIPATVFIITQTLVDKDFRHNEDYEYKYMGLEELRELPREEHITIGNHTATHPDLTTVSDRDRLEEEIKGARDQLESELNITINRFCYPGNKHDGRAREIVAHSHDYAVCGGGRTTPITADTNPLLIPRVNGAGTPWRIEWDVSDLSTTISKIV